jgi:hypothetical protein
MRALRGNSWRECAVIVILLLRLSVTVVAKVTLPLQPPVILLTLHGLKKKYDG